MLGCEVKARELAMSSDVPVWDLEDLEDLSELVGLTADIAGPGEGTSKLRRNSGES